ncbi:MAG: fructoselysine 6-kinase [Proteobacteria bacterium]|nr:fructoselysine 6-kinase [Pseudomonadota bacterium]MBS0571633.1 fructoselysine 6-kinase [Pseudomonadota bacterium]
MRFDLAAVGDNCIDRLTGAISGDLVGGNAVNVAVQAARLGLCAAYAGAVGPAGEAEGDRVAAALAANSVDARLLERRDRPTSLTLVHVGPDGDRRFLHEDFGACAGWTAGADALAVLARARHVHIGWLQDGGALRRALAGSGPSLSQDVSVNAAPADLGVAGLDLAFASLPAQAAANAEARARDLVEKGAKAAVVTLGLAGSLALAEGRVWRAPAPAVAAIDTTGAGDAYIAGFLAARFSGAGIAGAMAAGHENAARCCLHPGGFPQEALSAGSASPTGR